MPSVLCVVSAFGLTVSGVAAAVEQEVLVLVVRERFGVERHADEVEIRIEAVHLYGIFDVVGGRSVAVVVGIQLAGRGRMRCIDGQRRQRSLSRA